MREKELEKTQCCLARLFGLRTAQEAQSWSLDSGQLSAPHAGPPGTDWMRPRS